MVIRCLLKEGHPWMDAIKAVEPDATTDRPNPEEPYPFFWDPAAGGSVWYRRQPGEKALLIAFDVPEELSHRIVAQLSWTQPLTS